LNGHWDFFPVIIFLWIVPQDRERFTFPRFANSDRWFSPQATKKGSALRAEISQIVSNQTNKKDRNFTSLFNEHEFTESHE
jgi:hypothetical protein